MSHPKPTLEYGSAEVDMKARLQRLGLWEFVAALAIGFALAFAWVWLLKTAVARHTAWVGHIEFYGTRDAYGYFSNVAA
jgi:hypothetical protein